MKPAANSVMLRQSVIRPPILYISTGVQLHASRAAMPSQIVQPRARCHSGARGTSMLATSPAACDVCAPTDMASFLFAGGASAACGLRLSRCAAAALLQGGDLPAELVELLLQLGNLGLLVGFGDAGVRLQLCQRLVHFHLSDRQQLVVVGLLEGRPL